MQHPGVLKGSLWRTARVRASALLIGSREKPQVPPPSPSASSCAKTNFDEAKNAHSEAGELVRSAVLEFFAGPGWRGRGRTP